MRDLILLSEAQMRQIKPHFSVIAQGAEGR